MHTANNQFIRGTLRKERGECDAFQFNEIPSAIDK